MRTYRTFSVLAAVGFALALGGAAQAYEVQAPTPPREAIGDSISNPPSEPDPTGHRRFLRLPSEEPASQDLSRIRRRLHEDGAQPYEVARVQQR